MFWEKRFKKVEDRLSLIEDSVVGLIDELDVKLRSVNDSIEAFKAETHSTHKMLDETMGSLWDRINGVVEDTSKAISSVRDNVNKRIKTFTDLQNNVNSGQQEINKSLLDQIEKLTNKVDVLVETHHNVSMFHNLISGRAKKS